MKTSKEGIEFISQFEGFRDTAYRDVAGVLTIGYGHVLLPNSPFEKNKITMSTAKVFLSLDIETAEKAVNKYVEAKLTQNEFDALVSFTFNLGAKRLRESTLLKHLNRGDKEQAANEFPKWNRAGGRVVPGLERRRKEEKALFLGKRS